MSASRTIVAVVLGLILSTSALQGQDRSRYRDYQLGGNLPSVLALAKVPASDARTIHQRPALLQELSWRRPFYLADSITPETDPVQEIVFSFYNDQLSRMVVNYDRTRTDGLTDADMIEAIATSYGAPQKGGSARGRGLSNVETESGTLLARWGDAEYSVVLYRSSDYFRSSPSRFRIIVASPRLEALAGTALAEARRLDVREAPQRDIDRRKQDAEDARVSQEKARVTNRGTFRP